MGLQQQTLTCTVVLQIKKLQKRGNTYKMASLKIFLLIAAFIGVSYCQTYGDGSVVGEFDVKCSDTNFAVFFNKTALDERTIANFNNRSYVISFDGVNDPSCRTNSYDLSNVDANFGDLVNPSATFPSSVHIGTAFGGSQCGVNVFQDSTHIIYNTTITITYGKNVDAGAGLTIGREEYDHYNVMCLRNRTIEEKLNGDNVNVNYRLTGNDAKNDTSDFSFALTHSDMNGAMPSGSRYQLGDFIKFKLEMLSVRTETKAVIQRCWATSDGKANEYALITNRCDLEEGTKWVVAPNDTFHIFRTEAFRYIGGGALDQVFVECLVRVCSDNDAGASECQLCPFMGRKRREVKDESSSTVGQMSVVKSPIFYIIDREGTSSTSNQQQSSGGALSGTNGLIVMKVFFSTPAAPVAVTAYQNKAMA